MENRLARDVLNILTDAVGDFIARAMINRTCQRIGITPEGLEPQRLPELADGLEKSLALFADAATGRSIAEKIRGLRES